MLQYHSSGTQVETSHSVAVGLRSLQVRVSDTGVTAQSQLLKSHYISPCLSNAPTKEVKLLAFGFI